jgi:ribosomal protein S18 acetylase RimI-like enzyme
MGELCIQKMGREHIRAVVRLDRENRRDDFLPALGEGFLSTLYNRFLTSGETFGFVALENDRVAAFIIGSEDTQLLFRKVIRSAFIPLGFHSLPGLLRRPPLIKKLWETFSYPEKSSPVGKAELVVMGTGTAFRRRGLGRALVTALNRELIQRGVVGYQVMAKDKNLPANIFYRSLGFIYEGSFQLYDESWNRYIFRLEPQAETVP